MSSYKSERKPAADHLAAILRAYGFSVWVDYQGLIPGEGYAARLEEKVKSSHVVLVLWCKLSVASEWVRKEANWAKTLGTYIPVWIEDALLPEEFRGDHTLALKNWNGDPSGGALLPILRAIGDRVGKQPIQNFDTLTKEHQTWVRYGMPSLASFSLSQDGGNAETTVDPPPLGNQNEVPIEGNDTRTGRGYLSYREQHGSEILLNNRRGILQKGAEAFLGLSILGTIGFFTFRTSPIFRSTTNNGDVSAAPSAPIGSTARGQRPSAPEQLWVRGYQPSLLSSLNNRNAVRAIEFSPDANRLIAGCSDDRARLWDLNTGELILTLQSHSGRINSVAYSPDGSRLVSCGDDGKAIVWSERDAMPLQVYDVGAGPVWDVKFSPDGGTFAVAHDDGIVRVFDVSAGTLLIELRGHLNSVLSVAYSQSGQELLSGSKDGSARVWNLQNGNLAQMFSGHEGWVTAAFFAVEAGCVLTASADGNIRLWGKDSGLLLRAFGDRNRPVSGASLAQSETCVATVSGLQSDVWGIESGERLISLPGHAARLRAVKFSSNEMLIALASEDGLVRVFG